MFGDDDLEARVKEVRQQWKDAVGTVQSSRQRSRGGGADTGSTSLSEAFGDGLSAWTLAKYMLGGLVLLIIYASFGIANPYVSIASGIVGVVLVRKGNGGEHLPMLLGLVFLLHPGIVLMTVIGLNFAVMGALIGIAGFALSAMEGDVQRAMGPTGAILFQSISAVIIPIWFLALANVILSVFAANWFNLSFVATVITAVGTSAYLFAGGNIADGVGVYLGVGSAFLSIWERAFIGYDAHGSEELTFVAMTGVSGLIFVYGVYLAVSTPSIPFGPVVPFVLGMLGPLALYWLLHDIKVEHLQSAGRAAYQGGAAVGGAVAGGGRRVASAPGRAVGAAQERFGGPAEEEGEGDTGGNGGAAGTSGGRSWDTTGGSAITNGTTLTLTVRSVSNRSGQLDLAVEDSNGNGGTLYGDPATWARVLGTSQDAVWDEVRAGMQITISITDPTNVMWTPGSPGSSTIWAGSYDIRNIR